MREQVQKIGVAVAAASLTLIAWPGISCATQCWRVAEPILPEATHLVPFGLLLAVLFIHWDRRRPQPRPVAQALSLPIGLALGAIVGFAAFAQPTTWWGSGVRMSLLVCPFLVFGIARPRPRGKIALTLGTALLLLAVVLSTHTLSGNDFRMVEHEDCAGDTIPDVTF